jgi:hypothetical protein
MALKDTLAIVQFYTQFDPYTYVVDNRPLNDLKDRDDDIADELDARVQVLEIVGSATPTVVYLPAGWSQVRNSVGNYTITHNYNDAGYVVIPGIAGATTGTARVVSKGVNSFVIETSTDAGAAADRQFSCLVSKY